MRIEERQRGEYSGIGATIEYDPDSSAFFVVSIAPGSPGEEAGLQVGDNIIAVDGTPCTSLTQDELVAHVRGEEGTKVVLSVARGSKNIVFIQLPPYRTI